MTHVNQPSNSLSRRRLLAGLGGALAVTSAAGLSRRGRAASEVAPDPADRKLLFVIGATGGASIIDSFMPVASEEVPSSANASALNVYRSQQLVRPTGSNIRCVKPLADTDFLTAGYSMQEFLESHYADLTVVAHEVTSVNHAVAQKRAVTGASIDGGRTIAEAVAARHGTGLPLANCNMAQGGYVEPGDDAGLPGFARGEVISDPRTYAVSTHGSRGVAGGLSPRAVARARRVRDDLELRSGFGQTYRNAPLRERYLFNRSEVAPQLEDMDAIRSLMMLETDGLAPELGLDESPLIDELRSVFPQLGSDRWQQQGALSFLLSYFGMACANTLSLSFNPSFDGDDIIGAPLAFDYSHTDHRSAQNVMWGRVLQTVDGLVRLLKQYDYLGDPSLGKMWDRSLIYIATDFGRDKLRPEGQEFFSTGHHLNNGSVFLSPLLQGNRVFGGVDPSTMLTHGFDTRTGEEKPGTVVREPEVYSLIAQALDVDFEGRRDMSGLLA